MELNRQSQPTRAQISNSTTLSETRADWPACSEVFQKEDSGGESCSDYLASLEKQAQVGGGG